MEYPVYLQLRGTENVYAVQGPDRFWECTRIGGQWLRQDVVCNTWPDRQRVLDMLEDGGPWEPISAQAFLGPWLEDATEDGQGAFLVKEHVDLAPWTTFGVSI